MKKEVVTMNLKTKISRKALSWLVSIVMIFATIGINSSFLAFATKQQEVDFCVDKMKNLPTDDEFLNKLKKMPNEENLNQSRHEEIVHSDGSSEPVDLNEKEVYEEIKRMVEELTKEFETQESAEEMLNFADKLGEEDGKEEIEIENLKNSNDLPAKMKKANAIYRWVAENIYYDFESVDREKNLAKRKPQDAYFVFATKTGVCAGYSELLNLMMRMAGIPCMEVGGLRDSPGGAGHRFSAIYIEDEDDGRKGWTLLDSCWASPDGSDGDAEIKKYLSGEDFFDKDGMENVLAEKNDYTDELYDKLKISETYVKLLENPSQELADDLNKKIPDILKELNEKYKDSSHFETFEFFVSEWGSLYFKYKTDLTMEQAKQAKDKLKEIGKRQRFKEVPGDLTGKSKIYCGYIPSADSEKNNFGTDIRESLRSSLQKIHGANLRDKVSEYCDELEKIFIDVLFSNLDGAKEHIEDISEELNKNLGELNENYSDLTTIKKINLRIEKGDERFQILGEFDTELSEQDLETKFEQYYEEISSDAVKEESGFAKYFPAFYKKDQSFEEANRSVVTERVHTIDRFDVGDYGKDFYTVNMVIFDGNSYEGAAKIFFDYVDFYDINYMIGDINKIVEYGFPIRMKIIGYFPDKLVLKNVESIEFYEYTSIKEIDTTGSDRYILEDGVLYEKTDDGGKKSILKFYNGEYRTIEYLKNIEQLDV